MSKVVYYPLWETHRRAAIWDHLLPDTGERVLPLCQPDRPVQCIIMTPPKNNFFLVWKVYTSFV